MSRWTDEFLESMRQQMDPLADATVKALFEEQGLGIVRSFQGELIDGGGNPKPGLPEAMAHYIEETTKAPTTWSIDHEKLETAERLMNSHGPLTFLVLGCASLPECYIDHLGMPVLFLTQKLNTDVRRRVIETCLYAASVLSTKGFSPTGRGLDVTRKVRLMHAATRYLILQATDEQLAEGLPPDVAAKYRDHGWKEELGLPINQEDLAYTLQTFAWVGVRGMGDLGLKLKDHEKDAIIHCWNVAGHYLGVDSRLMPEDATEAEQLFEQMKARVKGNSTEGESLTAALLTFAEEHLIEKLVPTEKAEEHVKPAPEMLMRYLVGDETADLLGIRKATEEELHDGRRWLKILRGIVKVREAKFDALPIMRGLADRIFQKVSVGGFNRLAGPEAFEIPEQLAEHWTVVELPEREQEAGA